MSGNKVIHQEREKVKEERKEEGKEGRKFPLFMNSKNFPRKCSKL